MRKGKAIGACRYAVAHILPNSRMTGRWCANTTPYAAGHCQLNHPTRFIPSVRGGMFVCVVVEGMLSALAECKLLRRNATDEHSSLIRAAMQVPSCAGIFKNHVLSYGALIEQAQQ